MEENNKKQITLDASGKKLGRLASQIAVLLQGKNEATYAPNKVGDVVVTVENLQGLEVSEKKMKEKTYQSYSGYPGGLKERTMAKVIDKKGMAEVLRMAVKGMLPKNKLQKERMKNLIINEN